MGGLTEAYAMASMQFITFDAEGNCIGSNFMDYLLPTAWETPGCELHEVVTPVPAPPDRRQGRRRVRHRRRPGRVRQRRDGRDQGHRRPQHRHAAAARPGLRGAHPAARRVRRAAGAGRTTEHAMDEGWDVLEQAGGAGRPRRGVRAGHGGLAAGAVVRARPARGRSSPPTGAGPRLDRGACAEPVVIREAQRVIARRASRGCSARARPSEFGAGARGDDRHPDRRARARAPCRSTSNPSSRPRPASWSAARRWPTRSPTWPAPSAGGPGRRPCRTSPPPTSTSGRWWWSPPRATVTRRRIEQAVSAPPGVRRPGRLPQAGRGAARRTSPSAACRSTCSTGCARRSGSTWATPPTGRSRSPCWPSWCSSGPRASFAARAERPTPARAGHREAVDPVCGMTVRRRRRSPPPLEHDGDDLLLLLRRLPRPRSAPTPRRYLADQEA